MTISSHSVEPRQASPPRRVPPPGACDAHAHIFGPPDRFPPGRGASYDPPPAPYESYCCMLDSVGSSRGMLVQPAAYLSDHRAIQDACKRSGGRVRGIGLASSDISDGELADLRASGILGLRFVEVADPKGGGRFQGSIGFDELFKLAPRMKALGMQAHLWADCARLVADAPALKKLGIPLVADHMGRPNIAAGVSAPEFQEFLAHVEDGSFWVKLALCRASTQFPDYPDARPFHDAFVAGCPDRLVWGSDWPHIRLGNQAPDVGHLLDLFDDWVAGDETLRAKVLVDNPANLFRF